MPHWVIVSVVFILSGSHHVFDAIGVLTHRTCVCIATQSISSSISLYILRLYKFNIFCEPLLAQLCRITLPIYWNNIQLELCLVGGWTLVVYRAYNPSAQPNSIMVVSAQLERKLCTGGQSTWVFEKNSQIVVGISSSRISLHVTPAGRWTDQCCTVSTTGKKMGDKMGDKMGVTVSRTLVEIQSLIHQFQPAVQSWRIK